MICRPDSYYPKPKIWLTRHTLLRQFNNRSLTPNSEIQQFCTAKQKAKVFKGYINLRVLVLRDLNRFLKCGKMHILHIYVFSFKFEI